MRRSGSRHSLSPFSTNYSINDYSGINSRDSEYLRPKMHGGMEQGLTTAAGTLEAWPYELSFQCIAVRPLSIHLTAGIIAEAAAKSAHWDKLATGSLEVLADSAKAAP